jgi:TorA maturation chaperone TorD
VRRAKPIEAALGRAQSYRAAARAFAPPTDAERLAAELRAWAARSSGPLAEALARAEVALSTSGSALAAAHERLLGGRGCGVACRETPYADARRIAPTDLADLAGFLRAFGLTAASAPPDHVCTECELASVLALKEAYALAEGWTGPAALARSAYERLLAEHLACWIPRFAERVREAATEPFYTAAADALEGLVRSEAERLGVAVGGRTAPLVAATDTRDLTCGETCGRAT